MIAGERESRIIHYSANYGVMDELIAFLTGNCYQGQACLPKTAIMISPARSAPCRPEPAPQTQVAEGAIQALKLADLPTEGLHPKAVEVVMDEAIDLVVTVCDNANVKSPSRPALPHR